MLGFITNTLFPGVITNAAWDAIKFAWDKVSDRSFEELYIESFSDALDEFKPHLQKYGDGEISIDQDSIKKALVISISGISINTIENEDFQKHVAQVFSEQSVLIIGGNRFSEDDYLSIALLLVKRATRIFLSKIKQHETVFRGVLLTSIGENANLLNEIIRSLDNKHSVFSNEIKGIGEGIEENSRKLDILLNKEVQQKYIQLNTLIDAYQMYLDKFPYVTLTRDDMPTIDEIYVELELTRHDSGSDKQILVTTHALLSSIYKGNNILIQGEAGSGKSTLLNRVAKQIINDWQQGKQSQLLPVLISAKRLASAPASLSQMISEETNLRFGYYLKNRISENIFDGAPFSGGKFLLLIDGMDEIINAEERQDHLLRIQSVISRYSEYQFVLTSRQDSRILDISPRIFERYTLANFNPDKIKMFVEKWFSKKVDNNDKTKKFIKYIGKTNLSLLASNPLYLTLILLTYTGRNDYGYSFSRYGVLEKFIFTSLQEERLKDVRDIFKNNWAQQYGDEGKALGDKLYNFQRGYLEQLALAQQEEKTANLSFLDTSWLPEFIEREWLDNQIVDLLSRSGLVQKRDTEWVFIHKQIQEYLASCALSRLYKPTEHDGLEIIFRYKETAWVNIILFLLIKWQTASIDINELLESIYTDDPKSVLFLLEAKFEGLLLSKGLEEKLESDYFAQISSNEQPWSYYRYVDVGKYLTDRKKVINAWLRVISSSVEEIRWPKSSLISGLIELNASDSLIEMAINPQVSEKARGAIVHEFMVSHDVPALTTLAKSNKLNFLDHVTTILGITFSGEEGDEKLYELCYDEDFPSSSRSFAIANLIISKRYDLIEKLLTDENFDDHHKLFAITLMIGKEADYLSSLLLRSDISDNLFHMIFLTIGEHRYFENLRNIAINLADINTDRCERILIYLDKANRTTDLVEIFLKVELERIKLVVIIFLEQRKLFQKLKFLLMNSDLSTEIQNTIITILFTNGRFQEMQEIIKSEKISPESREFAHEGLMVAALATELKKEEINKNKRKRKRHKK